MSEIRVLAVVDALWLRASEHGELGMVTPVEYEAIYNHDLPARVLVASQ